MAERKAGLKVYKAKSVDVTYERKIQFSPEN